MQNGRDAAEPQASLFTLAILAQENSKPHDN